MKYFLDTEFLEGKMLVRDGFFKPLKAINTIDLISIGIVSEDYIVNAEDISSNRAVKIPASFYANREYYAISKDFNIKAAWNRFQLNTKQYGIEVKEYWIRKNVLKPIFDELSKKETNGLFFNKNVKFTYKNLKRLIKKYGKTNKQIAEEIHAFIYKDYLKETGLSYPEAFGYSNPKHDPEFYAYYADYDWLAFCWLFGTMNNLPNGFPMYCIDLKQMLDEIITVRRNKTITKTPNIKVADWNDYLKGIKRDSNYPKQTNEHNALADAKWNKELHTFIKNT